MKQQVARTVVYLGSMLLAGLQLPVYGQLSTTSVELPPSYNTFIPPAAGNTYVDPVFGSTIKRVSNAMGTPNAVGGGNLTWIENEYATMSAFNTNNSNFILVHQSYFGLYDGNSGSYIRDLPLEISASSEPRWSRKDNATLYYHYGNQLKSYNISTGATNVVHTFSQYSAISGNGESDISLDGDHFVFAGDGRYIFVYQISTDSTYTAFDTAGTRFDSIYITPHNNVIVSWLAAGTARFNGQELFDINMNFQRQLSHADGHKHLTVDTNGDEVLIWTNSNDAQPIANCQNGIVKIRLADATQTCLVQLDWSLAVHITAPDGNGYAYFETYAPGNPTPGTSGWAAYTNELVQVKLDGTSVSRWAHHRSRPLNSYNYEPKATISRDGTRLLYASDYDLQSIYGYATDYGDTYLIVMGSGSTSSSPPPPPPPPPPGPTTTTSVVRFEQNSSQVHYTGNWYTNSGSFNSGGSATLAMNQGSTAKLTFTGTGVKWIGYRDQWSGRAQVYLDGAYKASVDTYSSSGMAQTVVWSASGLSNASHVLSIVVSGSHDRNSGGSWVWVDAFDVTVVTTTSTTTNTPPPTPPPTNTTPYRVAENASAVAYSGGTWYTNTTAGCSGGTCVLAMDTGARATLTFTGTGASWIAYRDQWSGIAQIYVDGAQVATVDAYANPQQSQAVTYSVTGLAEGTHTLAIVATGTHDAASGGNWVWVDSFMVTP